jgi:NADPH:quinone reductase-like Zn-dependent oxidoreductase
MELPSTMKAVIIEKVGEPIQLKNVEVPKPSKEEILVKIEGTTINPSDMIFVLGHGFGIQPPSGAGFEGFGTVVASGSDENKDLIGKKVSFWSLQGRGWADYSVVPVRHTMIMDQDTPVEHGTFAYLNPITCWGLFSLVQKGNHKGVIITAAASQCGRILTRISKDHGKSVIAVVRNDEQKQICLESGADIVLNMKDSDFFDQVKSQAEKLTCTIAIDCINGSFASKLLLNMPFGSHLSTYGFLSGENDISFPAFDLFIGNKSLSVFFIQFYTESLNKEKIKELHDNVRKTLTTLSKTDISNRFDSLDNIQSAWDFYEKNSSKGKVFIKMG